MANCSPIWKTLRPMGRSLIWMRENSAQSTASRWRRTSVPPRRPTASPRKARRTEVLHVANIHPLAKGSSDSRCPRRSGRWCLPAVPAWRRCYLDGLSTERIGFLCRTTDAVPLNEWQDGDATTARQGSFIYFLPSNTLVVRLSSRR